MTISQSFLPSNFSKSERDLQFRINKPSLAAAATLIMLTGCAGAKDDDTEKEENMPEVQIEIPVSSAATTSSVTPTSTKENTDTTMKTSYKNGTYSEVGHYSSPSGEESVNVSLTIDNGKVTASTFKGTAELGKSLQFQTAFGAGYQEFVVGKSIDEISLDVVNGSSLTPKGFMDALKKIKAEAAAHG